jgi:methionyl-tRNA formyltransferase
LKIIFAGTPIFAEKALQALLDKKHKVLAVLTQPDRPSGRGMLLKQSPVKQLATHYGLEVLQPITLKSPEIQKKLTEYNADVMIVAAYGLILPAAILKIPRLGCLNIHASLLPRWRGAAPIQRVIQAGDAETGITIMQMDAGLDTGDMLLKRSCKIEARETAETLHDKLATIGAETIIEVLGHLDQGKINPIKQDNENATYAAKLTKEESRINWNLSATEIERNVRSYNPFPGANTKIQDTQIKIWKANAINETKGEPGELMRIQKDSLIVACGTGSLAVEVLQRPNAKALTADLFVQGFNIKAGDRFISE